MTKEVSKINKKYNWKHKWNKWNWIDRRILELEEGIPNWTKKLKRMKINIWNTIKQAEMRLSKSQKKEIMESYLWCKRITTIMKTCQIKNFKCRQKHKEKSAEKASDSYIIYLHFFQILFLKICTVTMVLKYFYMLIRFFILDYVDFKTSWNVFNLSLISELLITLLFFFH